MFQKPKGNNPRGGQSIEAFWCFRRYKIQNLFLLGKNLKYHWWFRGINVSKGFNKGLKNINN